MLFKHFPTPEPITDWEKEMWIGSAEVTRSPDGIGGGASFPEPCGFQMEMEGDGGSLGNTTSCPLSFLFSFSLILV